MTGDLPAIDAWSMRQRIAAGEISAAALLTSSLRRADSLRADDAVEGLNLILSRDDRAARAAAGAIHQLLSLRPDALLAGVPVAVKDNIATHDMPTTCGSRMLDGYISPYEATVVERLRDEGAILVAKTNMDEFGMGSSNENSAYGPARNPVSPGHVTGGSSGGSAGCVAAGIVPIALGSDTGGSVRQPAAFCGIVGVKPTYGRVSRYGLVAFGSSLDQVGVFGRTVDDAALGLSAIAGHDPRDSTSSEADVPPYRRASDRTVAGLVVGRPREYFPERLNPLIASACDRALECLRSEGAIVRDVSLPHTRYAIQTYYVIAPAEASSNLARFDGVRYGRRARAGDLREMYEKTRSRGFGREVIRRILLGTYVLSAGYYEAYYLKAQQVRGLISRDFSDLFDSGVDVLFTPTTPTTAFPLGAISDPYEMYMSDIFTVTANLAGVPAMSVPIGRIGGLPVGGQIIAPHFGEETMFAAAYALERALGPEAAR